ncbi:Tm-1-like ATP-binding domain-containing protein [uncultured Sphaerochaeta sp.]|uniref:Tm-1-like ATP-binding domain-containing protein n=1 Tax=uncultured Sphaerochaeta sp. TaxID=886478 RepID=UPI002A0A7D1B|nr:Tm-1-like ATP-binding domain-containing protein [uncultured Sphaerochaeta sp.]
MAIIAVIASFDTKYHELAYVKRQIEELGCTPLLIDISTGSNPPLIAITADLQRDDVLRMGGSSWETIRKLDKGNAIKAMSDCVSKVIRTLHDEQKIDGVLGMGGLQNTIICSAALRQLPLGFPKFICSTIASGNRYFDTIVGDKDIVVMPSIVDFAGINPISEVVLANSVASVVGMVQYGKHEIDTHGKHYIGATLMGITNDTVMRAINNLTAEGENVISFHSTGIGGRVLESQIRDGNIVAVMDLCLHEMTAEYFGGLGYSKGANNRLLAAAEMGIPSLICPGGIDFACLSKEDFFADEEKRGYVWHSKDYLTHTRLWESEILDITRTIVQRINCSKGITEIVLPLGGLRTMSRPGEFFFKPDTIKKMNAIFLEELKPGIVYKTFDLNFDDPDFADICSNEMLALLEKGGLR